MSNILWSTFKEEDKQEYIEYLKVFGALSGLFKETTDGINAKKPYLYYRNHEKLYVRIFEVDDLTRKDSAFDAVANLDDQRIGIGLKTWIHSRDKTYQKVAEFNKLAPTEISPLIQEKDYEGVVKKVALIRNKRIELDKRLYNTSDDIYHFITRDDRVMNLIESEYDLIQLDEVKLIESNGKTFIFTDGVNNYKYYASKSVLMKEFDASQEKILISIPIEEFEDPFQLLSRIALSNIEKQEEKIEKVEYEYEENTVYLPIYSDQSFDVEDHSAFNAQMGKPKTIGSSKPRPEYEAYIPIPKWIHHVFPNYFGVNPFDSESIKASKGFHLHLPDGRIVKARNTQENGKSLQTNPQSILGTWILKDVFGLQPYEKLTMKLLNEYGVDSFKIVRIDSENYKIDLAETYAFEKWKLSLEEYIRNKNNQSGNNWRLPKFRPELLDEEEELDA